MKILLALGIVMFASAAAAHAAPSDYSDYSDYSDFIVVSVVPRSPKVQPIVMSVPVKEEKPAPLEVRTAGAGR